MKTNRNETSEVLRSPPAGREAAAVSQGCQRENPMEQSVPATAGQPARAVPKRLDFFERYLTVWVLACMVVGVAAGKLWFEESFLPKFHPVMIGALLLTLVLIFGFQSGNLTYRWIAVLLIAVPIVIQVYFNSALAYLLMRALRVEHNVAAPGALIGASNFFELAVAVAITLFGANSGAALATVVGVLVEVPVMLSVCKFCNRTRHWFVEARTGIAIS